MRGSLHRTTYRASDSLLRAERVRSLLTAGRIVTLGAAPPGQQRGGSSTSLSKYFCSKTGDE